MPESTLFTTGYAGFKAETFLWKLGVYGIATVVDVRDSPTSRNPVFAQERLQPLLEEAGLGYVAVPALGAPAPIRRELKRGGSWADYFSAYRAHLAEREAEIERLRARARETTCCLLCFERDATACHRSVLAEMLAHRSDPPLVVRHV